MPIDNPILSICVPTYNRGDLLDKLLDQLCSLSVLAKSKIEVCISDNFSSDATPDVIIKWQSKLKIIAVRQKCNLGASLNFQAVTGLSTAPWVLLIGDDDLLCIPGFERLLSLLQTAKPSTWVLADVSNQDGTTFLTKFPQGPWTVREFRRQILLNSLDPFGFVSMHVIPRASIVKFTSLELDRIYGWPHLALLFYDLLNVEIYVYKEPVVKRGGDGKMVTQTWRSNDWLRLLMQKTKLCCNSEAGKNCFSTGVAIREYFRWPYARQTFHARLTLLKRYQLLTQASEYIDLTNIHKFARILIKCYVCLLLLFPERMIYFVRKLLNPSGVEVRQFEQFDSATDGIDRGL